MAGQAGKTESEVEKVYKHSWEDELQPLPSPTLQAASRAARKNGQPLRALSRAPAVPARQAVFIQRSHSLRRCEARKIKFQEADGPC